MKDHENFVKASAIFAEAAPEARFVLIGAGTDEPGSALDRAIAASGIGSRFVRLGPRRDILPASCSARHRNPELGVRRGLPQRAGGGDGLRRALRYDRCRRQRGYRRRYRPRRSAAQPAKLAAAWERLRSEGNDSRAARGAAARQRVADRYALAAMIEAYRALYAELVVSDTARAGH